MHRYSLGRNLSAKGGGIKPKPLHRNRLFILTSFMTNPIHHIQYTHTQACTHARAHTRRGELFLPCRPVSVLLSCCHYVCVPHCKVNVKHICRHTNTHKHTHKGTHTHTHTHTHTQRLTHKHTHKGTHKGTHTHTGKEDQCSVSTSFRE